jgi:uncharacterized protein (UPF0276 family)
VASLPRVPAADGAGVGLRAPHYRALLERLPPLAFLEVHSENFFGGGGQPLAWLERFRREYPVSLHGVGLSLGSADALDPGHLERLAGLVRRCDPCFVSEHLCWSSVDGHHANGLLPLPFTDEALDHVVGRISAVQERLGRQILVENVASYVRFAHSAIPEWEFVSEVARRAGCGVLLDVSNIHVNAVNHGFDALRYLDAIDAASVSEIHLGGHEAAGWGLIDSHAAAVAPDVWTLYEAALARFGPRPTLVEWDAGIPEPDVLLGEAAQAKSRLARAAAAATPMGEP